MDKDRFNKLAEVSTYADEEAAVLTAQKLLADDLGGPVDLSDLADAARAATAVCGKGDLGGKIGDGEALSIATFGEYTAEAKSFPMAVVKVIVAYVKGKSIDKFFGEKKADKSKARSDGLGSPAGHGRTSPFAGRNY